MITNRMATRPGYLPRAVSRRPSARRPSRSTHSPSTMPSLANIVSRWVVAAGTGRASTEFVREFEVAVAGGLGQYLDGYWIRSRRSPTYSNCVQR